MNKKTILILLAISVFSSLLFANEAYIGARFKSMTKNDYISQKIDGNFGISVRKVYKNGRGDEAGLKVGDVLRKMNSEKIYTKSQLYKMLQDFKPEDEINVSILRDGEKHDLKIILGSRNQAVPRKAYLGVYSSDLSDRRRKKIGLKEKYGLQINVSKDEPAEKSGLKNRDVILEFESEKLYTTDQLSQILENYKAGDKITVRVYRDGKYHNKEVVLSSHRDLFDYFQNFDDFELPDFPELPADFELPDMPDLKDFEEIEKIFGGSKKAFYPRDADFTHIHLGKSGSEESRSSLFDRWFGIQTRTVTLTSDDHPTETFVHVTAIVAKSPAKKAGLKKGDKILEIADTKIEDIDDILKVMSDKKEGATIKFLVSRKGKQKGLKIIYKKCDLKTITIKNSYSRDLYSYRTIKKLFPFIKTKSAELHYYDNDRMKIVTKEDKTYYINIEDDGYIF